MAKRYVVVPVKGLTPRQLEDELNIMDNSGYSIHSQSNIQWYQGLGEDGVLILKRDDEPRPEEDIDTLGLIKELVFSEHYTKAETYDKIAQLLMGREN